ncbi:MAG: YidC/Oxa1 family membrane protein insertase [Patescibacteria group bacterium]
MPHGDAGLAIIATVLIMRAVLYPVFTASIRTQMGMTAMQGDLALAEKRYKDDKEALARERIALLKKHKVNPLSGILALVIQLTLIISLYYALFREGFPNIDTALLYPFVHAPQVVSTSFFGLLDLLTPHHIFLALIVGATQFLAIRLTLMRTPTQGTGDKAAVMAMQQQMMRYFMPAMIAVFSYFFAGAVGLYFLTGNVVSIAQEWLIRRHVL